ncbi:MAG: hypothetical protein WBW33_17900 [Bryobacteraceae bacterium]
MASITGTRYTSSPRPKASPERPHHIRLGLAWTVSVSLIIALGVYGFSYYRLGLEDRPLSPLHPLLRPSGTIGLRLGMLGVILFCVLFLYPIRRHVKWLSMIGKTRHWLDFHVLVGITAPVIITYHASFKLGGIAGVAYWIMIAVAVSGFAGRYIYAQIPRSLNTAQLSLGELQTQSAALAAQIEEQTIFRLDDLAPLLRIPSPAEVRAMPFWAMLWTMLTMDLSRPLRVSRLRRRVLHGFERVTTLGGLFASRHQELEDIISRVREQSWLRAKMVFLERVQSIFHLWHVIHRPFSYSFAALVAVHIVVVILMGYY